MRLLLIGIILIPIFCQSTILTLDKETPIVSSLNMRDSTIRNNIDLYTINASRIIEPEYIWENSTKLTMLCDRIQSRYTNNTPVLVYNYWASSPFTGFGSMLHAVVALIASAAAGNYHLYFLYPQYNLLFKGCYSNSIIEDTSQFNFTKKCVPMNKCFGRKWFWNVDTAFGNHSVYTSGSNIFPVRIIENPRFMPIWEELFEGIESNVTFWNIRKMFIHLFLNPSPDLRQKWLIEEKSLLRYNHTIGLQLRMGGKVSDSPELDYWGVPFSRLDDVIKQVLEVIESHHWKNDVQLYIASDSTKAVRYIQERVNGVFPVVESTLFRRGHTRRRSSRKNYLSIMGQVLSDFYYISKSDHVIVSWQSTLGRMMCYAKNEDQCEKVLHWNSANKKVRIPEKV